MQLGPAAAACWRRRWLCGLRSLFVGFETLNPAALRAQRKVQNLHRDYGAAIRRLARPRRDGERQLRVRHGRGRAPPSSTAPSSGPSAQGIETATFHILTPYPGTALFQQHGGRGPDPPSRLGPLRHAPRRVPHARHDGRGAGARLLARLPRLLPLGLDLARRLHQAHADRPRCGTPPTPAGWKKFEPLWDMVIRARRIARMRPVLEPALSCSSAGAESRARHQ